MKVNYKTLYTALKQQKKVLQAKLQPNERESINHIPDDFNQNGWDLTIEKLDVLRAKLVELSEMKGNLLTPQFYRSIYNRALIATNEAEKLIEKISLDKADIDYETEVAKLNVEIVQLQQQLEEKAHQEQV